MDKYGLTAKIAADLLMTNKVYDPIKVLSLIMANPDLLSDKNKLETKI